MGRRAAVTEEAVDHRCANARSTAYNAGPALTQRRSSLLCYLGTDSTPLTIYGKQPRLFHAGSHLAIHSNVNTALSADHFEYKNMSVV